MFKKYQHIERFGNTEVNGIENGLCYIFYKIDGSNSSIWYEDGELKTGNRYRELTIHKDNYGFYKWVLEKENIKEFFMQNPNARLFGEWLVPHSLKTYRDNAWSNFYVFDLMYEDDYMPYSEYASKLDFYKIKYIPPICTMKNPTEESLIKLLDKTDEYLIKDGAGKGEGIIIKNYDFVNKYGRTVWAKIVTNEFKEKNKKEFGIQEYKVKQEIERKIVDKLLTSEFINKEYAKIENEFGWSSKHIPKLLGVIFYEFIKDEAWNIIKKFKNPIVDFKKLQKEVTLKVKEIKPELF